MPPPTHVQGYYLFYLPVAVVGQNVTDTAEVRLYYQRRDHAKQVDPEKAHLAFLLQLSRGGSVEVHVDLYRKHLRCRIECLRQEAADLFQQSSPELEERLQDIGYVVDAIHSVTTCSPVARSEQPSTSGSECVNDFETPGVRI
ncbi:MAG: flagellar hook-length control protein FliK [Candidatus Methylomirabilis oxyfera]|nr:flagellar hook-length control protein FliK [Candidatus Methylomirabilis oxyfera]